MAEAAKVLEPVAFAPHQDRMTSLAGPLRTIAVAGDVAAFVERLDDGPPKPEEPKAAEAKCVEPPAGSQPLTLRRALVAEGGAKSNLCRVRDPARRRPLSLQTP